VVQVPVGSDAAAQPGARTQVLGRAGRGAMTGALRVRVRAVVIEAVSAGRTPVPIAGRAAVPSERASGVVRC
jgi:hypothetical protein